MKTTTKCLFGGALMAAGMGNAMAQEFTLPGNIPPYADTLVQAYVYDFYTIGNVGGYNLNGGFGDSYSVSTAYGAGSASITSTSLSAMSNGIGNTDYLGGAFAQAYGYLSVTMDAVLNLAWDFTGEGGFGPLGEISIVDWTNGGVEIFGTDAFTAGTASVNLMAGINYGINVVATSAPDTSAFASANLVPAPGVMGLIGAAGLVATRRRR